MTVVKHIRVFSNQNPWMTTEVRQLLQGCNTALRSGNKEMYNPARADLWREIKGKVRLQEENRGSPLQQHSSGVGLQQLTWARDQTCTLHTSVSQ